MQEKLDIKLPEVVYINPRKRQKKLTPQFNSNDIYEAQSLDQQGFVKYIRAPQPPPKDKE